MKKTLQIFYSIVLLITLAACSSIPMATPEKDRQAKAFSVVPDKAQIYLYRNEFMGAAFKFDVLLDRKPIGKTAAKTFIALSVAPGKHTLISRAENDDDITFEVVAGKNYFVWQEVKMGMFSARNKLQIVDEVTGKSGVNECKLVETE